MLFRIIGRIVIAFLRGIGRAVMAFGRGLRRNEGVVGLVLVVALIAGLFFAAQSLFDFHITSGAQAVAAAPTPKPQPTAAPQPTTAAKSDVQTANAPKVTEDFIRAQSKFDADMMWQTLSPDFQQQLEGQGTGKDALSTELAQLKDSGQKLIKYQYIAGYATSKDATFHFYILTYGGNGSLQEVPRSFIVDSKGQIISFS